MAETTGVYNVLNDDGSYDVVNLKTTAEQVFKEDGKTIQNFFDAGGTIGGDVTVSGNIKAVDITASDNIQGKTMHSTGDITTDANIRADVNIVTKTGIVEGKTVRSIEDLEAGKDINVKGYYQSDVSNGSKSDTTGRIMKLFDGDKALEGDSKGIRFKFDKENYIYLGYDGEVRFYSEKLKNVEHRPTIYTDGEGHTRISNGYTMMKLLNLGSPEVQMCNTNNDGSCGVKASYFNNTSSQKYKTNIREFEGNPIDILKNNNVKEYNLKADVESLNSGVITQDELSDKLGFILEELTEDARRVFSPKNSDGVDTYCIVSMLWKICQEQQKRIEALEAGANSVID